MTSTPTPEQAALYEKLAEILGPNDPEPTEAEALAHRQALEDGRQARAAAYRQQQLAEVRRAMIEHDRRKAARDAGEPYVEPGEPI